MTTDKTIYLTPEGLAKLQAELEHLTTVGRHEVAHKLGTAADDGDLSENAAYDQAKEDQARLEGRIIEITNTLRHAVTMDQARGSRDTSQVGIGTTVTVTDEFGDEETYTIVSPLEAAPRQGRISHESPVGRALLNQRVGNSVEVAIPSGVRTVTIVRIS